MNENFRSIELRDLKSDELYHHGVLGMSWGKRNGPPYPLGGADKKFARAEAKRKKQREKQIAKMQKGLKKARKAKARADKRERKSLIAEEKLLRKKEALLKRDNYSEIMKNKKLFTTQELREIRNRHDAMVLDKMNNFLAKTNTAVATVSSIANLANAFRTVQSARQQSKRGNLELAKLAVDLDEAKKNAEKNDKIRELDINRKITELESAKNKLAMDELEKSFKEFERPYRDLKTIHDEDVATAIADMAKAKADTYHTLAGKNITSIKDTNASNITKDDFIKFLQLNANTGGGGGGKNKK